MPVELVLDIISGTQPHPSGLIKYDVSKDLQQLIEAVIGYTLSPASGSKLAITDGRPALCFLLDTPSCLLLSGSKESRLLGGYLSGTFLENTYIRQPDHTGRLLVVRFSEESLYHLLGKPLSKYHTRSHWSLTEVFGNDSQLLFEQMEKQGSVAGKVKIIEAFIRRKVKPPYQINPTFRKAVQTIKENKGQVQIDTLAHTLGVSYKWMERNFQKYFGVAPKEFSRLHRFLGAYAALTNAAEKDWLGIAIHCGYYDQNHFIKDFKRFTGRTPASLSLSK